MEIGRSTKQVPDEEKGLVEEPAQEPGQEFSTYQFLYRHLTSCNSIESLAYLVFLALLCLRVSIKYEALEHLERFCARHPHTGWRFYATQDQAFDFAMMWWPLRDLIREIPGYDRVVPRGLVRRGAGGIQLLVIVLAGAALQVCGLFVEQKDWGCAISA